MKYKWLLIFIAFLLFVGYSSLYVVDETKQVVVTQFGEVIGEPIIEPGLKTLIPFIQKPNFFPKNLQQWDGEPGQIPTLDKTYIYVDVFARWKIVDPVKFYQTVTNVYTAQRRLDGIIDPAVRNFITRYRLIETVRNSNRELDTYEIGLEDVKKDKASYSVETGREQITEGIVEQARPKLEPFGIEIVDIQIKRVNYVEEVRKSVYGRMIAERKQIAEKFRSEGRGAANKIIGEKDRDLKQIQSEAYKTAQEIKGKADAESTKIYAEAYNVDPEFYSFIKTLEVYSETMDEKSSLILSTDSELLRFIKGHKTTGAQ